uniref:Uncharacterized protein n=1 Tax=Leersia perrieri TaxID=77586 RepID=A0A0D9WY18_9ORYZ
MPVASPTREALPSHRALPVRQPSPVQEPSSHHLGLPSPPPTRAKTSRAGVAGGSSLTLGFEPLVHAEEEANTMVHDERDRTLCNAEAALANTKVSLHHAEEAVAKRERAVEREQQRLLNREMTVKEAEQGFSDREASMVAPDQAITERETDVRQREMAARRAQEEVTRRMTAIADREKQHLASGRLTSLPGSASWSGRSGPCHANPNLVPPGRRTRSRRHANTSRPWTLSIGPGSAWWRHAWYACGRWHGLWEWGTPPPRDSHHPRGLSRQLDELVAGLREVPAAVDEMAKSPSFNLARKVASLILASYQSRDPNFGPYIPTEDFPAGTEEVTWGRVEDAVEAVMVGFKGTEPAFQLAFRESDSDDDEEGDSSDKPAA